MTVEITLTTAQVDATVFDLYSNVDLYTTPFETGVLVAQLQAGYTSALVPDGTTIIRVQSVSASCVNYIDLVLVTTTTTTTSTTTTTTTIQSIACNATTNSGGAGVTEFTFDLSSYGGCLIMDFNAQSVPDKLEILHDGIRVATTGMTTPNAGPFDTLYGDPTVPTSGQAAATDQFIGSSKGTPPNRNAEFLADTGITGITANRQQLIWFQYTNVDWIANQQAVVRVTGPSGTAWNLDRVCQPELALTDVIFNTSDSPTDLWQYSPATTLETFLFTAAVPSSDVAHTENKLWIYNSANTELLEWDITLTPWNATFNRTITNVYTNSGLCAIDDTTLVNVNGLNVYSLDITNAAAVPTLQFNTGLSGHNVSGDYVYTVGGKLIMALNNNLDTYIVQFDWATGTLEFYLDITATVPLPYGLYQNNGEVFIVNQGGEIYSILTTSPYTLTLEDTLSFNINGASQIPSQITEEFISNTTTTTSSTTTTTTTAAPLTSFLASTTTGDHCVSPDLSPYDQTLYHNGIGAYPTIGDTVYTDAGGTITFNSQTVQMDNLSYLSTNGSGVSQTLSGCE